MKKREFFKVEGNKINRIRKHCPKCGPAVFLAEHKNRFSCGKCGYTEFKSSGKKQPASKDNKPSEKPAENKQEKPEQPKQEPKKEEKSENVNPEAEVKEKEENKKE